MAVLAAMRAMGAKARQILAAECERQNFADGVNREQATSYHRFVFDFLAIAALAGGGRESLFLRALGSVWRGWSSSSPQSPRAAGCADRRFGRRAGGGLAPDAFDTPFRSMLNLGASLFRRSDWDILAGGQTERARWMSGGMPEDVAGSRAASHAVSPQDAIESFPDGGTMSSG